MLDGYAYEGIFLTALKDRILDLSQILFIFQKTFLHGLILTGPCDFLLTLVCTTNKTQETKSFVEVILITGSLVKGRSVINFIRQYKLK